MAFNSHATLGRNVLGDDLIDSLGGQRQKQNSNYRDERKSTHETAP
jgi:hypothetical protein